MAGAVEGRQSNYMHPTFINSVMMKCIFLGVFLGSIFLGILG